MKTLLFLLSFTLPLFAWQTTFEAENANNIFKAIIETEHAGFTGAGYVNFDNEPGGYITFKVNMLQDSVQEISFVFANGSVNIRQMELTINDSIADSLDFGPTGAWVSWDTLTAEHSLVNGLNTIKITGLGVDGGPNIDKMIVSGLVGPNLYQLTLSAVSGIIQAEPLKEFYQQDSMVTLTAMPDEGFIFRNWLGDLSGDENPITLTMDEDKSITALFEFNEDTSTTEISNTPIGFATLDDGTTGGAGGDTLTISDAQSLVDIMLDRDGSANIPLVIFVSGTIAGYDDMIDIKRTANISLLGLGDDAGLLGFGVKMVQSSNIIIRNLTFADSKVDEKDGLTVDGCNNIWIDHCTFTDSPSDDPGGDDHDGLLDVKRGSYNVTISHNYFTNHRKTALLGHSVNEIADSTIKVTYYANWFDGTNSRHPRIRYGKVHLLNNLYTNLTGYGVGVTCDAQVLLEGNYFENTSRPVLISQVNDFSTLSGDPEGFLKAVSNLTIASGDIVENLSGYYFDPLDYYSYQATDSHMVKSMVMASAGAEKLDIATSISKKNNIIPQQIFLSQNYPNPFNPSTLINYQLTMNSYVTLQVFDVTGRIIKTLVDEAQSSGAYSVEFIAADLTSAVYFYQLRANDFIQTKKMILIK